MKESHLPVLLLVPLILVLVVLTRPILAQFHQVSAVRTTPVEATGALNPQNQNYYQPVDSFDRHGARISWLEAKLECEQRGGHLVTIANEDESTFIYENLLQSGKYYHQDSYTAWGPYIGAYYQEGQWRWVTGSTMVYDNWYTDGVLDEPDGTSTIWDHCTAVDVYCAWYYYRNEGGPSPTWGDTECDATFCGGGPSYLLECPYGTLDDGSTGIYRISLSNAGSPCGCPMVPGCDLDPVDVITDARGNRFELRCLGSTVGYFALVYIPVDGPELFVGKCPWYGGRNEGIVKYVDAEQDGTPDYFIKSLWNSFDTHCDDLPDGLQDQMFYDFYVCPEVVVVTQQVRPAGSSEPYVTHFEEKIQAPEMLPDDADNYAQLFPPAVAQPTKDCDEVLAPTRRLPLAGHHSDPDSLSLPVSTTMLIAGQAEGGAIEFTIEPWPPLIVDTEPGQSADVIAGSLEAAVNSERDIWEHGVFATAEGPELTLTGVGPGALSYCSSDAGLTTVPGVEHLSAEFMPDGTMRLSWDLPSGVAYDRIDISVDAFTIARDLSGSSTEFDHEQMAVSGSEYVVVGYVSNLPSCSQRTVVGLDEADVLLAPPQLRSYPNPGRRGSTIEFELDQARSVQLRIFDVAGRHIVTLLDGRGTAGVNSIFWDGQSTSGEYVAHGIYIVRLDTGGSRATLKVIALQ